MPHGGINYNVNVSIHPSLKSRFDLLSVRAGYRSWMASTTGQSPGLSSCVCVCVLGGG